MKDIFPNKHLTFLYQRMRRILRKPYFTRVPEQFTSAEKVRKKNILPPQIGISLLQIDLHFTSCAETLRKVAEAKLMYFTNLSAVSSGFPQVSLRFPSGFNHTLSIIKSTT